jgi:hypothetical protein
LIFKVLSSGRYGVATVYFMVENDGFFKQNWISCDKEDFIPNWLLIVLIFILFLFALNNFSFITVSVFFNFVFVAIHLLFIGLDLLPISFLFFAILI